jgi:hypothetical protein
MGSPTPSPSPSPSPVATPVAVNPDKIFTPSNPAGGSNEDEDIAAYVWDLKVVPYEDSSGVPVANNTYPITYRATLPQFLEISFKAFSPQAARSLEAQQVDPSTWFNPTNQSYKNQIAPHIQVFKTRIRLQNARTP